MIRRAQAEALLKLAEALEECERNGLTFGSWHGNPIICQDEACIALMEKLNGVELRMAITKLYPKSEEAE
jgi:hypothetical protein